MLQRPHQWWFRCRPFWFVKLQLEQSRHQLLFGFLPREIQEELVKFAMGADYPLHYLLGKFVRVWERGSPTYFQITGAWYLTRESCEARRVLTEISIEESLPPSITMKFLYEKKRKGLSDEEENEGPRLRLAYGTARVTLVGGRCYVQDCGTDSAISDGELVEKVEEHAMEVEAE